MARLSKQDLIEQVVAAFRACGWQVIITKWSHPFDILVSDGQKSYRLHIYIWNVTHGGGAARPAEEYRIQITGLDVRRFTQPENYITLILGWWSESSVFAGFDFYKHQAELGASPSLQIKRQCLDEAYLNGISTCDKENQEIAVAFRSDFIAEYVSNLRYFHGLGRLPEEHEAIHEALAKGMKIAEVEIDNMPLERKVLVTSVQRRWRSSNFREKVLRAYNHSCAMCGLQLELVEAAHVLPVVHPESNDSVRNGVSLCTLHHVAYDKALVTFDEAYDIHMNSHEIDRLSKLERVEGLDIFRQSLRQQLLLPPDEWRPDSALVATANAARGWKL